jgi:hypothetical protein
LYTRLLVASDAISFVVRKSGKNTSEILNPFPLMRIKAHTYRRCIIASPPPKS